MLTLHIIDTEITMKILVTDFSFIGFIICLNCLLIKKKDEEDRTGEDIRYKELKLLHQQYENL